jgi:hypothetical protein
MTQVTLGQAWGGGPHPRPPTLPGRLIGNGQNAQSVSNQVLNSDAVEWPA